MIVLSGSECGGWGFRVWSLGVYRGRAEGRDREGEERLG